MKNWKKLLVIAPLLLGTIIISSNANANATTGEITTEKITQDSKLPFDRIKNEDSILRVSENTYIHGQVAIYDLLDMNNPILELDSDNNILSKKAEDIRNGDQLISVTTHKQTRDRSTPPSQTMSLGTGAYATGNWSTGNYWHYADYAYQAAPAGPGKSLYFTSAGDSMLAGDSEDWNNTHNTGVGHGVFINAGGGTEVIPGVGYTLSCWSWGPASGSKYMIYNTH